MAFRLEDFKKTTRKAPTGGVDARKTPASVYPHQMRDRKALARLEVAIRTFDALVGRRRAEMDAGAMTEFFGDPRLARGVVACLGQVYAFHTPQFAEIVGERGAARLRAAGMAMPMALRAHTYASVNQRHDGFLAEAARAACYEELAAPFGLTAHDWDALLHLDAEDNQVLRRAGAVPGAADVAAAYNFHALDTVLRRAVSVTLDGLSLSPAEASEARALARAMGLAATVSGAGSAITLSEADHVPLLPRRAGRLGRTFLMLAQAHATRASGGHCDAVLGARRFRLTFSTEIFKALGALSGHSADVGLGRRWAASDALWETLRKELLKQRAANTETRWRVRRLPEPIATAQGVFLPDVLLLQGARRVLVAVGSAPEGNWGAPVLSVPVTRKTMDAAAVLMQASQRAGTEKTMPDVGLLASVPAGVRALCDRAAAQGLVRAGDAQRALHLSDEMLLVDWVRQAADPRVRYIPGVGLCASEVVSALSCAAPRGEQSAGQMTLFSGDG